MKNGAIVECDVVDLSHDGRGIARFDGKALFVEGALPGERVRARMLRQRRQFDEAALVEVLAASAERVIPLCRHFGVCGGCTLQHLAPAAQILAKQRQLLETLQRIGRVRPDTVFEPVRGPAWAYRRRARLGVRLVHKKGRVLAGFRERDKPYLADIRRCEILEARFADLPSRLAELVEGLSLRDGGIPQVELAAGDGTGGGPAAALTFRVMSSPNADDLQKFRHFALQQNVQIYLQSGGLESLAPLDSAYPPLAYFLGENNQLKLEFGPADFVQINREVNRAMVAAAVEHLRPESTDRVLDLFCGLGNFSLPLAQRARQLVGIEAEPKLTARARANADLNGLKNAEFHADDLFEPDRCGPWVTGLYDLVLLDPPRAGASRILERVAHWQPRRVVYISCHPGSLARDAGILVQGQGYELRGAGVMDMFPHTTHVESIAVFERLK